MRSLLGSCASTGQQLLPLGSSSIAQVLAVHSLLTKFIRVFQISCLTLIELTEFITCQTEQRNLVFYLSWIRRGWKQRLIAFSPGPQELSAFHPLTADRQAARSVFIAVQRCSRRCLISDQSHQEEGGCGFETLNALRSQAAFPFCHAAWALQLPPG